MKSVATFAPVNVTEWKSEGGIIGDSSLPSTATNASSASAPVAREASTNVLPNP